MKFDSPQREIEKINYTRANSRTSGKRSLRYLVIRIFSGQFHFKSGDQRTRIGGREAARARIQSLFDFIDSVEYTKSTMMGGYCTAQWSHKFVYVCMRFGGFFVFFVFLFLLYYIKIFGLYAW